MFGYRTDIKIRKIKKKEIWNNILVQLQKIYRDYLEEYDFNDSLYWYNERTNVGALSGAIWKLGGYALEEYVSKKGEDKKSGRTDLYFSIGDYECIVEAKQEWLHFNSGNNDFEEKILTSLNNATEDCENSLKHEGVNIGFGITFIIPCYKENFDDVEAIKQLEKRIIKNDDYDFAVIFSIDHDKKVKSLDDKICNSIYVVGREVVKS